MIQIIQDTDKNKDEMRETDSGREIERGERWDKYSLQYHRLLMFD